MILSRKKVPPDIDICVRINDSILKRVNETIFLGVTLTEKINWKIQIKNITKKISKYNGIIYLIRNILNEQTLKKIYLIFVTLTHILPTVIFCGVQHSKLIYIH